LTTANVWNAPQPKWVDAERVMPFGSSVVRGHYLSDTTRR
jgi:hypothetical protein